MPPQDRDVAVPTLSERMGRLLGAVAGDPVARADLEMVRVLDEMRVLGAEPIEDLTPAEARAQPGLESAARSVLSKAGVTLNDRGVTTNDLDFLGPGGDLPARLYRPPGDGADLPLTLYFHGGGWVYGDLDSCDDGPRAIAAKTGALVLSAHYRLAPEHKFPSSHEDAVAAYRFALDAATRLGGDGRRFAVMGEGVGAALALNVSIAARDQGLAAPRHQALIYPFAGVDTSAPSCRENEAARPLNTAMILWSLGHALLNPAERRDARIDLANRTDLGRLPPTTLLTAGVDPLRSEGEALGQALTRAGVAVNAVHYEELAHGFFGLGAVVAQARAAQDVVARELASAFAV